MNFAEGACGPVPKGGRIRTGDRAAKTEAARPESSGLPRKTEWSAVTSRASLRAYFDDLAIADCLATMRSRMCVKRHGVVAMDRYFKGVCRKMTRAEVGGRDNPATYMPPRRLWSRVGLKARKDTDLWAANHKYRKATLDAGNERLAEGLSIDEIPVAEAQENMLKLSSSTNLPIWLRAEVLREMGNFDAAKKVMDGFMKSNPNDFKNGEEYFKGVLERIKKRDAKVFKL